jgi:hypothetical protein
MQSWYLLRGRVGKTEGIRYAKDSPGRTGHDCSGMRNGTVGWGTTTTT